LVDGGGITWATTRHSATTTLKEISTDGRVLSVKRRPFGDRFDVVDPDSRETIAQANWAKMTILTPSNLLLSRTKARTDVLGWRETWHWSTSEGRLAITLGLLGNPMASLSSWSLGRVAFGELDLEEDRYLIACLAIAIRCCSKGA
jgi:hypothetical protein